MQNTGQIQIVIADKSRINSDLIEIRRILPYYYKKYVELKNREEAASSLAAGILLYRYLGISNPDQIIFGKYGKPQMKNGANHFNLSHAGRYVVLAIAEVPVGIDMEPLDGVKWGAARKVFPRGWMEELEDAPQEEQEMLFTVMWTRMEAVLKAEGTGFWIETRKNQVFLENWVMESLLHDRYVITYASRHRLEKKIMIAV